MTGTQRNSRISRGEQMAMLQCQRLETALRASPHDAEQDHDSKPDHEMAETLSGHKPEMNGLGYASDSSSGLESPAPNSPRESASESSSHEWPSCSDSSIALPRADVSCWLPSYAYLSPPLLPQIPSSHVRIIKAIPAFSPILSDDGVPSRYLLCSCDNCCLQRSLGPSECSSI